MDDRSCPECERLWAVYSYILRELARVRLAGEWACCGLPYLEDSHVFVRDLFIEHAFTHPKEAEFLVAAIV